MKILSLNLGSSSLKYAVHVATDGALRSALARDVPASPEPSKASQAARTAIADVLSTIGPIDAVGHRIVFGGNDDAPTTITHDLLQRLESLQELDPLHIPGALAVIHEAQTLLPSAMQIACFDTAFFHEMPLNARALPVPTNDPLVHRYGFHGLSYEHICHKLGSELKPRTVVAHLGNGASAAALLYGKPIDSTMGFSPLSGLIMSTRPGDIDPGVLLYLLERSQMTVPELRAILENKSGLHALSGGESDLQRLCEREDERAALAVDMFVRSAAKAIGALTTQLGGIDMLVFTGGIGEHNEQVRNHIVVRVRFLNDDADVRVVSSDENLMIAHHVAQLVVASA